MVRYTHGKIHTWEDKHMVTNTHGKIHTWEDTHMARYTLRLDTDGYNTNNFFCYFYV